MRDDFEGSFADYPTTIGELRSAKTHKASDWTPREVLIDVLRRIDSGEMDPDSLVVVYRDVDGDEVGTSYQLAVPDIHTALGLLSYVQIRLLTR